MFFSFRRWIASMTDASASMVIGFYVIQSPTVSFVRHGHIPRKAFFTWALSSSSAPVPESTTRPVSRT